VVVERTYDAGARQFADRWFSARVEPLCSRFVQSLESGSRVADLGCGPGRDLAWQAKNGLQPVGLDRSIGMLIEARRRQVYVPLVRADIRWLPFAADCLDGIWACGSLLHVRREEFSPTLQECHRVLVPGGVLALAMKEGVGERWLTAEYGPRFFAFYLPEELARFLRMCRFRVLEWWRQEDIQERAERWIHFLARAEETLPGVPSEMGEAVPGFCN